MQNSSTAGWLQWLKDAVYRTADLLDDFSTEFLWQKTMTGNIVAKEVRNFFSKENKFAYALKMVIKLRVLGRD